MQPGIMIGCSTNTTALNRHELISHENPVFSSSLHTNRTNCLQYPTTYLSRRDRLIVWTNCATEPEGEPSHPQEFPCPSEM